MTKMRLVGTSNDITSWTSALAITKKMGSGRGGSFKRHFREQPTSTRGFWTKLPGRPISGDSGPASCRANPPPQGHSGGIREALRNRFRESTPSKGGDEKAWVRSYVEARHNWLSNHSNKLLRKTVYRTQCFRSEIARENWMLDRLPIKMHGVAVHLPANPPANA